MVSTILASAAIAATVPAHAQQSQVAQQEFSIPAQPLNSAIDVFSRQTGWQVIYPSAAARGKRSSVVQGAMSASQALQTLASTSGLSVRITGNRSAALVDTLGAAVETSDSDAVQLDVIDVSGSRPRANPADAPYETAGSSSYISAEDIERFRGTSPGDFLESSPSVLVGAKRTSGAVDVNIRGMQGMDRVPVVVDGAQQSNTIYRGYSGVTSRSYVDPDFIGDVVIEKGPTLSADGAGATGGVVRMKTIDADDILLNGQSVGVRVRGGMVGNTSEPPAWATRGGVNLTVPGAPFTSGLDRPDFLEPTSGHGSLTAAARNENIEIVAGYVRRKLGNYHAGKNGGDEGRAVTTGGSTTLGGLTHYQAGEEVLNTSNDSESYLIKGVGKFDGGHRLELTHSNYTSTYFEMFPSQVTWFGGPYQELPSTVDLDTTTATYTWKPDDNDLIDFRANAWMTDISFVIGQSVPTILPGNPLWGFDTEVDAFRWGVNLSNTSRVDTAHGTVKLNYGISYTDEEMEQHRTTHVLLPYFPTEMSEPGKAGDRQEWSVFASAEWKAFDWLTLEGGLRYTATDTHDECRVSPSEPCKDTSNDGLAPIVAATVEPWTDIQFYARYAEAIRSASLYEATRGGESFTVSNIFDLVPEHAKNWEFGMNVLRNDVMQAGDALRFKTAYFDNDIDNYITRTYSGNSAGTFILRNLDNARFKGIEVSGSYDAERFFVQAGYTHYLETEFCLTPADAVELGENLCNPGGVNGGYAQLHLPPEHMASLTVGTKLLDQTLTLGTRVTYVSERPVEGINDTQSGWTVRPRWAAYTLVDLFASYKVSENVELDVAVDNVGDIYYVDALAIGLVPAPGRTFRASMTTKF